MHSQADIEVVVGIGDDAAVYRLGGVTLVETVDIITPVVDDPFAFGAISATNSISDVYAMGGTPVAALAISGFPACDYRPELMREILRGAVRVLDEAGAFLVGGHSFDDQELKFGLSVTGVMRQGRVLRVSGAREGEIVVLTKPLGIGILATGLKGGKFSGARMRPAVDWMLTSNRSASEIALSAGASACTDVTGFGLFGHAWNMVRDSETDMVFLRDRIPVLDGVTEMVGASMVPEGAYGNLRFLQGRVDFPDDMPEDERLVLCDPQTSGGLLITLREEGLGRFTESSVFHAVVGHVVKGTGRIRVR